MNYHEILREPLDHCVYIDGEWIFKQYVADWIWEEATTRASELDSPNSPDYDRLTESIEVGLWDKLQAGLEYEQRKLNGNI